MILATTTKYRSDSAIDRVRLSLTLATFRLARLGGYSIVCVDDGSDEAFLRAARSLGVTVVAQSLLGIGNARRQAIACARDLNPNPKGFIVWLEPEKYTLVRHLGAILGMESSEEFRLIMFDRSSLGSYPPEQQLAYSFGRVLSEYLLGRSLDLFFGPVAIRDEVIDYFINYRGEYGDYWDSIHIPKLRAILNGCSYRQIPIDYSNPPEQTESEGGDLALFVKRCRQAYKLSKACVDEFNKLRRNET